MQVTQKRPCPICNADQKLVLFHQRFRALDVGGLLDGYDVVSCQACGFCFADDLPPQAVFDQYYQEMSKYEGLPQGQEQSDYDRRRFQAAANLIERYAPDHQARILDVGCSTGGLLHALSQHGYARLVGIDPSAACAQVAASAYGIRVLTAALSRVPPGVGPFDVIVLGSVLEHIRDLGPALLSLRGLLAAEGVLYIEVPDATRFTNAADAPFQEFSTEHINYFSATSLRNLLRAQGFQELHSERTTTEQSPGREVREVHGVFRRAELSPSRPTCDLETSRALANYIGQSQQAEEQTRRTIHDLVRRDAAIIVWGVGTHTQRLLATGGLAQAEVRAFVDSNPRYQGKRLNGVPIIAPAALVGMDEPILISSRHFQQEIVTQIRDELKLGNRLLLLY